MKKGAFKLKKKKDFDFGNEGDFNLQKKSGNWGSSKEVSKKLFEKEKRKSEKEKEIEELKEIKRINP